MINNTIFLYLEYLSTKIIASYRIIIYIYIIYIGGAIATLAAIDLIVMNITSLTLINFGSPRVGIYIYYSTYLIFAFLISKIRYNDANM